MYVTAAFNQELWTAPRQGILERSAIKAYLRIQAKQVKVIKIALVYADLQIGVELDVNYVGRRCSNLRNTLGASGSFLTNAATDWQWSNRHIELNFNHLLL